MSSSSTRKIVTEYTGDVSESDSRISATNTLSPATSELLNLTSGANLIGPPPASPKGVTIVPPSTNTQTITLKGTTADVGVLLHPTDPTSIALGSTTANFILTTGGVINGLRLIWS